MHGADQERTGAERSRAVGLMLGRALGSRVLPGAGDALSSQVCWGNRVGLGAVGPDSWWWMQTQTQSPNLYKAPNLPGLRGTRLI